MHIESAACTHVGRRPNNEDNHLVDAELGLYVVADGMGGYEGGEVASKLVVESLRAFFQRNAEDGDATWPTGVDPTMSFEENLLRAGLEQSHLEVIHHKKGRLVHMGATVVAVAVQGDRAIVAHVGDSRVYRLRDGELVQLTRDHSLVEAFRALHPGEAPVGMSHVVTRAIGMPESATPEVRTELCAPGDVFLLCSDGVTDPLDDEVIAEILALPPQEAVVGLVDAAYEAGGSDNITALVFRVIRG